MQIFPLRFCPSERQSRCPGLGQIGGERVDELAYAFGDPPPDPEARPMSTVVAERKRVQPVDSTSV